MISCLLFADDVVLLASLNSDPHFSLGWFAAKSEAVEEDQPLEIRGHSFQLEMGGLPPTGGGRVTSSSGGVRVSRGLVHG